MIDITATGNPDWDALRNQFPVANDFVYFNHAAISPIPLIVKGQINECIEKYCANGIVCNREFLDIADYTRKLAAQLINAKASEIGFVKNTTQGIQVAANGIRWQKNDNVLIPEKEFPANVFPWLNLAKRGVEVRFIPIKDGRFTVEEIGRFVDGRTRAVSVSAVSFTNGFKCNLAEIGQLCKDKGIFFIVDAIQALGAMDVDVKQSQIDLLSAGAHKWLLGPQGIGVLYVSDSMLDSLDVSNLGYKSMIDEGEYLNYNIRPKAAASRFEEGTLNILGIVGLKASLEILLNVGVPTIQKRILELTDVLAQNLTKRGYMIKSPMHYNDRSGIMSFCHNNIATDAIYKNLLQAQVVCAQRHGAVRISPHFYNSMKDIDGFLQALP